MSGSCEFREGRPCARVFFNLARQWDASLLFKQPSSMIVLPYLICSVFSIAIRMILPMLPLFDILR